jgi:DNA modification methylase
VRKQVIVSKHLDNPEVARAKNLEEAYKGLKRMEEQKRNEVLAKVVGETFSKDKHTILHGDAIAEMGKLPAESFDVICTDPPYGIDANEFGDAGGRLQRQVHAYADDRESWEGLMAQCAEHFWRLAKPEAHLYICCDIDGFHFLRRVMEAAGWWVHRTPLVNYKLDGNRVPWPEHGPQRKWELVLYAVKGKRRVTRIYPDVVQTRGDENLGHGAQKPIELYVDLLRRSVAAGNTVLDPFCGTGTIFPAAHQLLCAATGIELEAQAYGIAVKRLQEL